MDQVVGLDSPQAFQVVYQEFDSSSLEGHSGEVPVPLDPVPSGAFDLVVEVEAEVQGLEGVLGCYSSQDPVFHSSV